MFTRLTLALVIVCAGLATGPIPASYADAPVAAPTAVELYEQGASRYERGDLAGARQLLRRVDPMQLPKDDRVEMYETLQAIDRQLSADAGEPIAAPAEDGGPTPVELLARADELSTTSVADAVELYAQVAASPEAGDSLKAVAQARLAQAQRQVNSPVTNARRELDLANADLEAGDVRSAAARIARVRAGDVELGWFDRQRLDRLAAAIEERSEVAVSAQAPVAIEVVDGGQAMAQADDAADPGDAVQPAAPVTPEPSRPAAAAGDDVEATGGAADAGGEDLLDTVRLLAAKQAAAEGREAEVEGNFNLAIRKYEEAQRIDPRVEGVADRLAALRSRRGEQFAAEGALEVLMQNRTLRRQQVEAAYDRAMNDARDKMNQGDYVQASNAVADARSVLDQNVPALPPQRYNELMQQAQSLGSEIERRQQDALARQLRENERNQAQSIQTNRRQAAAQQDAQVQDLLKRARALQVEQQYEAALVLLEQALFIDPGNIAAQVMRDVIQDAHLVVMQREITRKRAVEVVRQQVQSLEATIPYSDLITYPADWPQLTELRLEGLDQTGGESEINRQVTMKLREAIPINFEAQRLVNVVDYFRNSLGLNFFVNWPALEAIGVEKDTPISLRLNNVPADRALALVLQQASIDNFTTVGYSVIDGIVTISTNDDLQRTTDLRPYDIRDLLVQVPNFSDAPSFDLREALSNTSTGGGGDSGGGSSGGLFGDSGEGEEEEDSLTRTQRVEQITTLIQNTVGNPLDWQDAGGQVSSMRELDGQLIVKTTPDNHRQIAALLAQLREQRAIQISVEARFLLVDESFLEEIGVDLDMQINDLGSHFGPIGISQDSFSLAQRVTTSLTPDRFNLSETAEPGAFIPGEGFANTGRALDLGVSYIDDLEVNLLIRATQASQRSISLTAPRVTFFNGQRAFVLVVRQISFVSDLEPIPDSIGFDVTVSVLQVGVLLDVEGTVSADRRYVTLTLRPNLASTQEPFRQLSQTGALVIPGSDDTPGEVIPFEGIIELPELELTQVKATVSIPDKGTLLLGGQRLMADTQIESGVPVLSKVPLLNRFFTNTSTVKDSRTLLILVRPTIIIQNEQEEILYPGLMQSPGQYNLGNQ